jgi:UDP-N-acetylmuramoylalanine--D-glutamate ligase
MLNPYAAERVAGRRVVLDRLDRDGAALASLLCDRGADVVIADHDPVVAVPSGCALVHERDAAVARADLLMVDCWTGEETSHVVQARERGIAVGCLADLVLYEARSPVVGVTGTAGKTMTARLIAHLLETAGWTVDVPPTGRAENAWPSADSLAALRAETAPDITVVELTSTHLAYMTTSPTHAVVTTLWPDHVELHGGEGRYFAAKQRILARQVGGDTAVLPVGESRLTPRPGVAITRFSSEDAGAAEAHVAPHLRGNLAAALVTVRSSLAVDGPLDAAIASFVSPAWRGERIGDVAGIPVFHNGMAATPAKVTAFLRALPDRSSVLIVGGIPDSPAGLVHASAGEQRLLRETCGEIARVAQRVALVGPAAAQVAPLLAEAGARGVTIGPDLHWATTEALRDLAGVGQIAWVPGFPVDLGDRERFGELVATASRTTGLEWAPAAVPAKGAV